MIVRDGSSYFSERFMRPFGSGIPYAQELASLRSRASNNQRLTRASGELADGVVHSPGRMDERERSPPNPAQVLVDCATFVHPTATVSDLAGVKRKPLADVPTGMDGSYPMKKPVIFGMPLNRVQSEMLTFE